MQYFVGRYGEQILKEMMVSMQAGIAEIDEALSGMGYAEKFSDIFANWTIASYLNNCQVGVGQKYCYLNSLLDYNRLHLSPNTSSNMPVGSDAVFSFSDQENDWSGHWYELNILGPVNQNLIVNFKGDKNSIFAVPYIIYYFNETIQTGFLELDSQQQGSKLIFGSANPIKKIILMPISKFKKGNFSINEVKYDFSLFVHKTNKTIISPSPSPSTSPSSLPSVSPVLPVLPNYPDGSLLRAQGDYKIYVIKSGYKRWIQSPQIFSFYPHFGWQQVIETSRENLEKYKDASLVREANDTKVYEINGDGTKHWLNITAEQFSVSGRSWEMVYIINQRELNWYKAGVKVIK
jgi:hypothetical protein